MYSSDCYWKLLYSSIVGNPPFLLRIKGTVISHTASCYFIRLNSRLWQMKPNENSRRLVSVSIGLSTVIISHIPCSWQHHISTNSDYKVRRFVVEHYAMGNGCQVTLHEPLNHHSHITINQVQHNNQPGRMNKFEVEGQRDISYYEEWWYTTK